MNKGNQNTSSIIGDQSTADASFIPNLQNLSNDPYVTVSSDSSQFNIWQQFRMSNNFLESTILENYVTQTNLGSSITSYTLQGNFQGWVPTDSIYLHVPIEIDAQIGVSSTGESAVPVIQPQDPAQFLSSNDNAVQRLIKSGAFKSEVMDISRINSVSAMLMTDFAMLHVFERIGIYGGNNNQALGRTPMFDLEGMKQVAYDDKFDEAKISEYGLWGVPVSTLAAQYNNSYTNLLKETIEVTTNYLGDTVNYGSTSSTIDPAWYRAFSKVLLQTSQSNQSVVTPGGTPNTFIYTKTINVPLKLSMINSFFKTSQFLPPEFKYKIDLRCLTNVVGLCATDYSQNITKKTLVYPTVGVWGAKVVGPPKLVYLSHTLTQAMQDSLNTKWMTYPFLYNYETYELYDINCNNQTFFQQNISISQQRPTQLIFAILDTQTVFPPSQMGNAQVRGGLANKTIAIDANNRNLSSELSGFPGVRTSLNLFLEYFSISLSGRKIIEYKNEDGDPTNIPNSYDLLFQKSQHDSYKRYGEIGQTNDASFSAFNARRGGSRLCVTIAPGMYADKGFMPVDRGATMITVQMKFSGKLADSKKIQIIKKLPEQLCIDVNKNVTSIMWPAVKSNQGFLVQNTVNTQ
jgi:hypothetical protein